MRPAVRLAVVALIAGALAGGMWLASRGGGPDRRNLDAFVTVGGDLMRDATHPVLDLTRMSSGEEAALGEAIDREVRASMQVGGDPPTEAYLSRVLRALSPHVTRGGIPYTVAFVRSREINAFAVAGGRLYVTEGLIGTVESEAELAAVIGHEISHVDLRHCVERLQLEQAARKVSPEAGALARIGYEIMLRGFSEEQELAADRNGALIAARAGYDAWQANTLFTRFARLEAQNESGPTRDPVVEAARLIPEALRRYVATHPPADQRMEAVRRSLGAEPDLWRGSRRYVGRMNLATRRAMTEDPRENEWTVRDAEPEPDRGGEARAGG